MLQPKKTRYRKQQKGKIKGNAFRGHELAFGTFGIKSLETCFITGRQIEAARQAVTRHMKREGQIWIRIFRVKVLLNILLHALCQALCFLSVKVCRWTWQRKLCVSPLRNSLSRQSL